MPLMKSLHRVLAKDDEQKIMVAKADCCSEPDLCRSLEKNAKCNNISGEILVSSEIFRNARISIIQ